MAAARSAAVYRVVADRRRETQIFNAFTPHISPPINLERGNSQPYVFPGQTSLRQSFTTMNLANAQAKYIGTQASVDKELLAMTRWQLREKAIDDSCLYRKEVREFYHSYWSQFVVAFIILANFICEAIYAQMNPKEGSAEQKTFEALEWTFTIFFTIEVSVNLYGSWFRRFFEVENEDEHWGWNIFDFMIVTLSLMALMLPGTIEGTPNEVFFQIHFEGITVLRLFRAFRIARLFGKLKGLKRIAEGILKSLPGVFQVFVFLSIIMGIWAVIGVQLFRTYEPKYFGTFIIAMDTMFKVLLGDFTIIYNKLVFDHKLYWSLPFFLTFILIATILLMNVVVAVLLEKYLQHEDYIDQYSTALQGSETDYLNENYPTVFIKTDGCFWPVRSISWDLMPQVHQFFRELPPIHVDSDDEADPFVNEDMDDWDVDKVCRWMKLEDVDFGFFVPYFRQNKLDGKDLARLTIFQLQEMGMNYGRQTEFRSHIEKYLSKQEYLKLQMTKMKRAFDEYDSDMDGSLTLEEFINAWKKYTDTPEKESEKFAKAIFQELDEDDDKKVTFEEFKNMRRVFHYLRRSQYMSDLESSPSDFSQQIKESKKKADALTERINTIRSRTGVSAGSLIAMDIRDFEEDYKGTELSPHSETLKGGRSTSESFSEGEIKSDSMEENTSTMMLPTLPSIVPSKSLPLINMSSMKTMSTLSSINSSHFSSEMDKLNLPTIKRTISLSEEGVEHKRNCGRSVEKRKKASNAKMQIKHSNSQKRHSGYKV